MKPKTNSTHKNGSQLLKIKDGMENGFGYKSETGFWTVMNGYYRDFFNEWAFFDWYMEGEYTYNAGGVIATGACMFL